MGSSGLKETTNSDAPGIIQFVTPVWEGDFAPGQAGFESSLRNPDLGKACMTGRGGYIQPSIQYLTSGSACEIA
jgi:hypothetical protein